MEHFSYKCTANKKLWVSSLEEILSSLLIPKKCVPESKWHIKVDVMSHPNSPAVLLHRLLPYWKSLFPHLQLVNAQSPSGLFFDVICSGMPCSLAPKVFLDDPSSTCTIKSMNSGYNVTVPLEVHKTECLEAQTQQTALWIPTPSPSLSVPPFSNL